MRGATGSHHYATFYAVASFGDADLERIADAMQNIRGGRHAALYGDEEELEPQDLRAAREEVARLLVAAREWIGLNRPSLAPRLGSAPLA